MNLASSQALFWRAVRSGLSEETARAHFVDSERLGIYRTGYWARQVKALRSLFPRVAATLGEPSFVRTASRYLTEHPSTEPALERLGAAFPSWLAHDIDAVMGQWAAWEFATWEVFIAPDSTALPLEAAQRPGFEHAVMHLGPHVRVVVLVRPLLRELGHEGDSAAGSLAVWREGFETRRREVSAGEHRAIELACAGASVATLCALLGPEPETIFKTLAAWFSRGWVHTVRAP